MRNGKIFLAVIVFLGGSAFAQIPVVNSGGVVNLASYATGPVAPGSLVAIFGTNFVAGYVAIATDIPLPTNFSGVSVTFNGINAPILFVSSEQINAQIPWELSSGTMVSVIVTNDKGSSPPRTIAIGTINPGIFSFNYGTGQAVATNLDSSLAAPMGWIPSYPTRPATPGDTLTIYATGLGAVTPTVVTGTNSLDIVRQTTIRPKVLIGGQQANVTFCGLSPQFVGVNQINVVIPATAPNGDAVSLQLTAGNITTTANVTIALGTAPPFGTIPAEYADTYTNLQSRLTLLNNTLTEQWDGSAWPTLFGTEVTPADSYASVTQKGFYDKKITPYLNGLQSVGVKVVKFQLGFPLLYQPFYQDFLGDTDDEQYNATVAFYQQLINDLHSRGIKVVVQSIVAPAAGGSYTSDPYNLTEYFQSLNLDQYIAGRTTNVVTIAQQLVPDYINIEGEPDTEPEKAYRPELSDPAVNLQLVQSILDGLDSAGIPGLHRTMLIAAGMGSWQPDYQTYLANYTALPSLDIFDIHVHIANLVGSSDPLINIFTMASSAASAGKKIGMDEDWMNKIANSETGLDADLVNSRNGWSFWAPLDQMFVQSMVNTAYYEKMEYVSFSVPHTFFAYVDYQNTPGCPTAGGNSCSPAEWNSELQDAVDGSLSQTPVPLTQTGVAFVNFTQ